MASSAMTQPNTQPEARNTPMSLSAVDTQVLDFIHSPQDKDFNALALAVFAQQFELNLPYQRFCQARGQTPNTVTRWQDIPAVPTVAFKELDLACGSPEKIFLTSGTTRGQEKRGRHLVPDLALYHASALGHFTSCVLPDNRRLRTLALIPSPEARPQSSLTQMAEWIMTNLSAAGSTAFIDPQGVHIEAFADAVAQAQREGTPVCILAITSALVAFFDWCETREQQFALPGGSRIMDTGGNKGLRRPISRNGVLQSCWKYLKVAGYYCVNEYGMTEMASQFYDNVLYNRFRQSNEPRYKIGPAWVRTLVVDPETLEEVPPGQVGILRHFDLANSGSVMAIQTDDLGYTVGDGFEITGRAPGSEARGCALMLEEILQAEGA
ncbi:MAG: long-chain fatty acid--CoA ligase [Deltaproteobacteria bacterium]|nr:long-chain fatty acid--CoA ligase [Deltaproteobacteria bacterium]